MKYAIMLSLFFSTGFVMSMQQEPNKKWATFAVACQRSKFVVTSGFCSSNWNLKTEHEDDFPNDLPLTVKDRDFFVQELELAYNINMAITSSCNIGTIECRLKIEPYEEIVDMKLNSRRMLRVKIKEASKTN